MCTMCQSLWQEKIKDIAIQKRTAPQSSIPSSKKFALIQGEYMNTSKWSTLGNFVLEGILAAFSVSNPETIMTLFNSIRKKHHMDLLWLIDQEQF